MHTYYVKNAELMRMEIMENWSWILINILKTRDTVTRLEQWKDKENTHRFRMKHLYLGYLSRLPKVEWKGLVCGNRARLRVVFMLWMACNKRLATKDRLEQFGCNVDRKCVFCSSLETLDHLFFECMYT